MSDETLRRSQVILRMPVDFVDAKLVLHDGESVDVIFFIPPGETLVQFLVDPAPFAPVMRAARIMLIARAAIACVTIPAPTGASGGDELPAETQRAAIKLRSGARVDGELRWTRIEGRQRTADHANNDDSHIVLHGAGVTHHVAKGHIATIEELGG